jgi:hypothetical protein
MGNEEKDGVTISANGLEVLAEKHLQIINSWISNADTKAGLLLATVGILLGFSATYFKNLNATLQPDPWHISAYVVILASCVYAGFHLLRAAWICLRVLGPVLSFEKYNPDLLREKSEFLSTTDGKSLLYFSDIAELSLRDFSQCYRMLTDPHRVALHLLEQIHTNSRIAHRKFILIHSAVASVFHVIPAIAIAVVVRALIGLIGS